MKVFFECQRKSDNGVDVKRKRCLKISFIKMATLANKANAFQMYLG